MNVALVYDRINKWGGAERVLLAFHKLFPKAPLYTLVYDRDSAPWASVFDIHTSFLQNIPFARRHHELFPLIASVAFEQFSFDSYDLVISITSAEAKGIVTKPSTKHICYCLTPTRYVWSHTQNYLDTPLKKICITPLISKLRTWDQIASERPDYYIAISKSVKERIKKYYHRNSEIIHPPYSSLATENIKISDSNNKLGIPFFLVVSRLVPYKRVDIAIEACNKLNKHLVVVGTGSEERMLRTMAGPTILFRNNLTDSELSWYYEHCIALIAPQEEDFGLSIVEAQEKGKPIIAYKYGGVQDIVLEGKTGEYFSPQTSEALMETMQKFDVKRYDSDMCNTNAKRFSFQNFSKNILHIIHTVVKSNE